MKTAARRFVPLLAAIFFALVATAVMAQPGLVGAPSDCQTRYFGPRGLLSAEDVGPRSLVDLVKLEPEWDPQKKGKLRWRSVSRLAQLHKLGVFHGRSLYRTDYYLGNKRMLAVEHEGFIFCPILLHETGREAESILWENPRFLSSGAEEKILAMRTNRWDLRKPEALHYFRIGEDGALQPLSIEPFAAHLAAEGLSAKEKGSFRHDAIVYEMPGRKAKASGQSGNIQILYSLAGTTLKVAEIEFVPDPKPPKAGPGTIEIALDRAEVPYELKHYRVWVEEQDEELRSRQGNGGWSFWVRIEDKRSGLIERGLIGGWSLFVKDKDQDPPEFYTWGRQNASRQVLCRHRIVNDTCEAWCLVYEDTDDGLKASQADDDRWHLVQKCSDA